MGNKEFLVEISRDKLNLFVISFLIEPSKSKTGFEYYTLQLPMKQAFKLFMELDNSFDALVDLLYIKHNTLLLPNFLRAKFSPRNLANHSTSRTTTNQDASRYHGFGPKSALSKESLTMNENDGDSTKRDGTKQGSVISQSKILEQGTPPL